jgi:replicative DNA helicase
MFDNISRLLRFELKEEAKNESRKTEFKEKIELANYIIWYRLQNSGNFDFEIMLEGLKIGRYSHMIDMIKSLASLFIPTDDELTRCERMINDELSLMEALGARTIIEKKLSKLNSGEYNDADEFLADYSKFIDEMYKRKTTRERNKATKEAAYLDLRTSQYDTVMTNLREASDINDSVKTGFKFLENTLPSKGLEPKRFYLIGGTSGVGKSVFLANLIGNASKQYHHRDDSGIPTYVYFTAENLIDESMERFYCQMTGTSVSQARLCYKDSAFSIRDEIVPILERNNCNVVMYYFKPRTSTVKDIENRIDSLLVPGIKMKAIYIDYLDLFKTGMEHADVRSELSSVSEMFKNMAVHYNVPVVSVTQLNRSGYDSNLDPSLTQMSESMGKINYADVVMFLQEDKEKRIMLPDPSGLPITAKNIRLSLLKSRNSSASRYTNIVMKENIGPESIFNFVMEEKPEIDAAQNGYNNNSENNLMF